jgi:hypothetical protein
MEKHTKDEKSNWKKGLQVQRGEHWTRRDLFGKTETKQNKTRHSSKVSSLHSSTSFYLFWISSVMNKPEIPDSLKIKDALTEIGFENFLQLFVDAALDWDSFLNLTTDYLCVQLKIPLSTFSRPLFLQFFFHFPHFPHFPSFSYFRIFFFLPSSSGQATEIVNHNTKLKVIIE